MLTQDKLKTELHYDPETGVWTWLVSKRGPAKAGDIAGTPTHNGYVAIKLNGKVYSAHRLAFLYMTGSFPKEVVDHANRVKHDNRWENLRGCSQSMNLANAAPHSYSTAPYKGISFDKRRGKWTANISIMKRVRYLGQFDTPEEAHSIYAAAARLYYGGFAFGAQQGVEFRENAS